MFYRYRFESDMYPTLSRIPLHVRMKLDITGTKISLRHWLGFALEERWALCHLPVDSEEERRAFASYLNFLSRRYFGDGVASVAPITDPPWEKLDRAPTAVHDKSLSIGQAVTPAEWRGWNKGQRYALYKLASSKNEPEQFFEVLKEFREGGGDKP